MSRRNVHELEELKREIRENTNWSVRKMNGDLHWRINNVIDIWPSSRKWRATRAVNFEKTRVFHTFAQLKAIVEAAGGKRAVKKPAFVVNAYRKSAKKHEQTNCGN